MILIGATLKGENAEQVWDPDHGNQDIEYPRVNKLIVKQILLGVEAAENEYNVVEVRLKNVEFTNIKKALSFKNL